MKRFTVAAALAAACLLPGCATVSVERAKGIAQAGKDYASTLQKVGDLALDRSITFSADFLASPDSGPPRTADTIDDETKLLRSRVALVADANLYLESLGKYFQELENLAGGDQSAGTVEATGKLADALKREPMGLKLADAEKSAISGLAGFVARQVHASFVESALRRDAETIAEALVLSDKILAQQARWIEFRGRLVREKDYLENVRKPFLAPGALPDSWKTKWGDAVRQSAAIATVEEARKASRKMQDSWREILRGRYSFEEVQASLENVKAGIAALQALKDAKR